MPLQLYKIASIEVGSAGVATIDFQNIPQGYKDLKLVFTGRTNNVQSNCYIYFNNDTTNSNYSRLRLLAEGSTFTVSGGSASDSNVGVLNPNSDTANAFSNTEVYIPNYTASNNKTFSSDGVRENNANYGIIGLFACRWNNTAAINRIGIYHADGNIVQYSTATLYGIL
jgi:hypothetical protein